MGRVHWRAVVHPEGVVPREENTRCYLAVEQAADWLDTQMMYVEQRAERASREDDEAAVRDARMLGEERWTGTGTGLVGEDPAEWIGQGPAVEVLGVNYVVEGCECERGAAIEVAEVLAFRVESIAWGCAAWMEAAEAEQLRYEAASKEWMESTKRPDGSAGGVVPMRVTMLKKVAEEADKRFADANREAEGMRRRAEQLVKAASCGRVSVCGIKPYHQGGGCGKPARVYQQNAWSDDEECMWCGKSDELRRLGD